MIRTRRWDSLALAALLLAGLGVIFRSVMMVSFATIPIVFVAYGAWLREPPLTVDLERTLSPEQPIPGDDVTVELTVTNTGDATISDLRVIDGVPSKLGISEGSPRAGLFLKPDTSETLTYTVTARRGEHAFEPVTLITYTASGTVARRESRPIETAMKCRRPIEEFPLGDATSLLVGRKPTDSGGSGVEFYSQREYRPSDARSRIDWRRFAKSGDLSTVEYRQDRAASVHLLIDSRPIAFRSTAPEQPPAIEYSVYGAELCFNALVDENHRVGVGYFPADVTALDIGAGSQHRIEARSLFDDHSALIPPSEESQPNTSHPVPATQNHRREVPELDVQPSLKTKGTTEKLLSKLPGYSEVIMFTPLLDDEPADVVDTFRAHGYETIIVSPDVTGGESVGDRLMAHHRQIRIRALRERNITVVDWNVDDRLSTVLGRVI